MVQYYDCIIKKNLHEKRLQPVITAKHEIKTRWLATKEHVKFCIA